MPPAESKYRLTAEELVSWGGMSAAHTWDSETMRSREQADLRGLGVGLVSTFTKQLLDRGVPIRAGVGAERLLVTDGSGCNHGSAARWLSDPAC